MQAIKNFFKNKWVIEGIAVVLLAVLIWFVGPLIGIAGKVPLEDESARWIMIAFMVAIWLIYRGTVWHLSRKREQQLVSDLSGAQDTAKEASAPEQVVLQRGFEEALGLLKKTPSKSGGRANLYELPWYAIIGAPGAGKTTALINSGLHFPLAERLGAHAVKGVSGTRDCDWWFADEAILLDTAGRYTTQDSHQQVDASAWHSFLQLLKKYRPRRPLNGVFVAISVTDLLRQSEAEMQQHAQAVRQRIGELYGQLGVQLPVYVLFTKTDLLAGFNDFFANLTEDERQQVWGETFSHLGGNNELSANLQQFNQACEELIERIVQRRLKRMQDERDIQRRAAIFDFPQQLRLFKPSAQQFLNAVFAANRYEEPFLLRGVYFTSGTQEGTPIDRVMMALSANFRLDRQAVPLLSGRGKSYFIADLLKRVVFQESELVCIDPKLEKRYRLLKLSTYLGSFVLVALVFALWFVSYTSNKLALSEVERQIEQYHATNVSPSDSRGNLLALLPKLNALVAVHDIYQQTGWRSGFGLYQGDKVEAGANVAYERLLRERLLAAITQRLKERMQQEEGSNPEVLLQLLRVYLMLGDPTHMDAKVAQPWIKLDWERQFATDPETLAQLTRHLDVLVALQLDAVALDQNFVQAVRNKLTQVPLANQIYSRFKSDGLLDRDHDLSVAAQLAPNGARVYTAANGKDLDSMIVPGLFTNYGYSEWFLKKALAYVKEANEQNWVLGTQASSNPIDLDRLYGDVKRLYLADYQKAWDGVISGVRFRAPTSTTQLVDTLDLLSRPDSPMKLLLEMVEKNTSLGKLSAAVSDALSKSALGAAVAGLSASGDKLLAAARQSDAGLDPVKLTEAYFEPYNQQVRVVGDRPAPINATLTSIKTLHDYLMQIGSAANVGGQALTSQAAMVAGGGVDPLQSAKMEFARLPGPMASALNGLTSSGGEQIKSGAKSQLNELLKTSVSMPCKAALENRYPFKRNSPQDVLMADFGKVFAANGIMEQFFNANLKTFVDSAAVNWVEMASDKALGLSPDAIRQFQTAAKIRDAFFPGATPQAQVQFELKPVMLDPRVGTFRLNIEGQELVYRHGPEQLTKFQWPGPSNSTGVRVVFEALDGSQVSRSKEGAWALFRMFDDFNIEPTATPDRFFLNIQIDSYQSRFELRAASVNNPFAISGYQNFRCPENL
jgi:type VI secretion system protein ImpL